MMQNLYLSEGDLINIQSASLPVATFARFQPQTVDFLDITDPKAVYLFTFCMQILLMKCSFYSFSF